MGLVGPFNSDDKPEPRPSLWARFLCGFFNHDLVETEEAQWSHAVLGTPVRCRRCHKKARKHFRRGKEWIEWKSR